ncbi:MAG TPA: sugar-binding protein [bacterium]
MKWTTDGIAICAASNVQAYPDIAGDGSGGAFITWRDSRNYSSSGVDVYAQHIDASGNAKWTQDGIAICSASGDQMDPRIISDGSGGAIIAWYDNRDATLGYDIYVQRINASGAAQWTKDGVGYKAYGNQIYPNMVGDGSGGVIFAWQDDYFGDDDIRCHHIDASGNFAWPTNTWASGAGGNQQGPQVVTDGAGGAIIVWIDYRNGTTDPDIYADRIDASGNSKWAGWGIAIASTKEKQHGHCVTSDLFGGAVIAWMDYRNGSSDIYAQRMYSNGTFVWKNNGVEIGTAKNAQNNPTITRAGTCGAIITWCDLRAVGDPLHDTDWDIYAQRVFSDGSLTSATITVSAPNGGESWQAGTYQTITWFCTSFTDPVKIEYSIDNGSSYSAVTASTSNTGSYAWTVPNTPSTQCMVRISDAADGNPSDVSNAAFAITGSGSTGATISIYKTSSAPVFDGMLDDLWENAPLNQNFKVVAGGDHLVDDGDASMSFRTLWDDQYLYLFITVSDETLVSDSSTEYWRDDCIELWIDGDNSKGTAYDGKNDRGFHFSIDPNDPVNPVHKAVQSLGPAADLSGILQASKRKPFGVNLEVAFPLGILGITPKEPSLFGLEIDYNDDDDGGDRDTKLKFFSNNDDSHYNPSGFGTAQLAAIQTDVEARTFSPDAFSLSQNYPNPFNPVTAIRYAIPTAGRVKLTVCDLQGREVAVLRDGTETAGTHSARFDASHLASGIYVYKIETADGVLSKKLVLMK